jgi:hypothetical protein
MMGTPPVEQAPEGAIELHRATFDDDREAVVSRGVLVVSFRRLGLAIEDPRCTRPHLRVLNALMRYMNYATGTAFCSRKTVADKLIIAEKTVDNCLYDLRRWGHIDWQRLAAPELHPGRRLLHYTLPVVRYSEEDIEAAIRSLSIASGDKVPVPTGTKSARPNGKNPAEVPVLTGSQTARPNGHYSSQTTPPQRAVWAKKCPS